MSADDFVAKYRAVFLGLLSEAYCMRRLDASSFGMVMDGQYVRLDALLRQVHRDLVPALPLNGQHQKQLLKVNAG